MTNIQEILNNINRLKFAQLTTEQTEHIYGGKMQTWRYSEQNRIKNQNAIRHNSVLKPGDADEIRRLHWEENSSITDLHLKYKINPGLVRKILKNEKHFNPDAKYIGVKFRKKGGQKRGNMNMKKRVRISVYDENMNYIETTDGITLAKRYGYNNGYFACFFNRRKDGYNETLKKFFFKEKT